MSYECSTTDPTACGRIFASLDAFDSHLESYPETGPGEPEKPSRCISDQELAEKGVQLDPPTGKWVDVAARERARTAFGGAA